MPAALVGSPLLTRPDLFARLEKGHAEQVTVVTPNRRLAQDLQREFDAHQIAKDLKVWEAPDILPFAAFVERLWEDALYSELGEKLPWRSGVANLLQWLAAERGLPLDGETEPAQIAAAR